MGHVIFMGLVAGLGTCLGSAFILLFGRLRRKSFSLLLGLSAGAMLAVILLDLLPASLSYGRLTHCLGGTLAGLLFIGLTDLFISQEAMENGSNQRYLAMGYLIVFGIAAHDLPEGLAIAAGSVESMAIGPLLTLVIGLHNIPEGMATAAPLRAGGMKAGRILVINMLLSLVTPLGSTLGVILINLSGQFISFLLAFAGGAMSYIVFLKLLPESVQHHRLWAQAGILSGMVLVGLLNLFF